MREEGREEGREGRREGERERGREKGKREGERGRAMYYGIQCPKQTLPEIHTQC